MSPRGFRLTACCVTALLVVLVPLAAAEGGYWKAPDTLTFPGGGSVAAGRVENLLEQDGRTLKLSDTRFGGIGSYQVIRLIEDEATTVTHNWTAVPGGVDPSCPDDPDFHYLCVDELNFDDNTTYLYATNHNQIEERLVTCGFFSTYPGHVPCAGDSPGDVENANDILTQLTFRFKLRAAEPALLNLTVKAGSVILNVTCFQKLQLVSSPFWQTYIYNFSPLGIGWDEACFNALRDSQGIGFAGYLFYNVYVTMLCDTCGNISFSGFQAISTWSRSRDLLGADLSLGATGYYPIRAEWTCTARTGGPYYLGALNATGGTRWFNVTRDATNVSYPSGEMCAVAGATERYHATMTAADIGSDSRVHFRLSDNSSDPSGSAWGNVTLDRLVAILTQDFAVSVGNLGWLVYLGFITVGILLAAFGYHRWKSGGGSET